MSYIVGSKNVEKGYAEEAGYAINGGKGWEKVAENHQIDCHGEVALAMGTYYFTCATSWMSRSSTPLATSATRPQRRPATPRRPLLPQDRRALARALSAHQPGRGQQAHERHRVCGSRHRRGLSPRLDVVLLIYEGNKKRAQPPKIPGLAKKFSEAPDEVFALKLQFQSFDAPPRALLNARRGRRAGQSRARGASSARGRAVSRRNSKGGGARRVTLGGRNGPHDRAQRFSRRASWNYSVEPMKITGRTSGQCGGERQPSRAGPSVGRSATSAAEQLAIAQSCDQRGNNPPTQRGLLSTLTSTPQLTKIVNHRLTVFSPRSRSRAFRRRNRRCVFVHTITTSPEEFFHFHDIIQHYVSPSSLRRAVVDGFALLRFVVAAFLRVAARPASASSARRRPQGTSPTFSSEHSASTLRQYAAALCSTGHRSHRGSETSGSNAHAATNDASGFFPSETSSSFAISKPSRRATSFSSSSSATLSDARASNARRAFRRARACLFPRTLREPSSRVPACRRTTPFSRRQT